MTYHAGESCGEGTLITLKEEINARSLSYSCYDVFGDPTNQTQVQDLSICTSKIITAVQQGMPFITNDGLVVMSVAGTQLGRLVLRLKLPDCLRNIPHKSYGVCITYVTTVATLACSL